MIDENDILTPVQLCNKAKFYLDKLVIVCKGLIEIADKCIEEQKILWVIGY